MTEYSVSIAYFHPHRHAELDSASPNKKTKIDAETCAGLFSA
jgi:hypothetical protein